MRRQNKLTQLLGKDYLEQNAPKSPSFKTKIKELFARKPKGHHSELVSSPRSASTSLQLPTSSPELISLSPRDPRVSSLAQILNSPREPNLRSRSASNATQVTPRSRSTSRAAQASPRGRSSSFVSKTQDPSSSLTK
ncbi:hypothetical protein [Rickettsiales endosymbiont of Stachyamoeba lipophora]|uniref:hypothetical protein n=1 Tax=Rickettsiales endosymbiont of Stachyamoeba lipophora TaxID=2486578 RepID=UPI000F647D90|nr:hypothetical protein [Rickettsiales endosymbiont of Stachyamoeba lipophora]AZL15241.1 hypothetical protein EF513_01535 [Rickettsiales endosymbiont of Stachyamoeba lipophora]